VTRRRSLLFAPCSKPDIFAKALASGADIVCADLEDAVGPGDKGTARPLGVRFLRASEGPHRALRINSLRSRTGLEDMMALQDAGAEVAGTVCLPKVDSAEEVCWAAELLRASPAIRLGAFFESARGLQNAFEIASASPRLDFFVFGAVDLSTEMNLALDDEALAYARGRLSHAASAAGIDLLDVPCLAFRDVAEVERQARLAKRLGFAGKTAIHPSNIAAINAVFSPSAEEIAEAQAIVAAYEAAKGGVTTWKGKLVEEPVVKRMIRLMENHAAAGGF
jgi:citrate lyase subunit beta/citryl-CoA lyase/(S)-citramalyl-CoA lyase